MAEVEARARDAAPAIEGAAKAIDEQTRNSLTAGLETAVGEIASAKEAAVDLFRQIVENAPRRLVSEEQLSSLQDLKNDLNSGEKSADQVKQALFALANSNPNFQSLADQLSPLLDRWPAQLQRLIFYEASCRVEMPSRPPR
ncbi:hypothetical protein AJ87_05800 [Rhizobium yanglingense]|nr:hypothetical protein AJ87_05800 [Rhizobium yanglingense]